MKSPEGMFEESVVYVTTQGAQIRTSEGRIIVIDVTVDEDDEEDPELASYPVEQVDTINAFGGINFTTPFVKAANEYGIVLNYFSTYGNYRGSYVPEKNTIAEIRRASIRCLDRRNLPLPKRSSAVKSGTSGRYSLGKALRGQTSSRIWGFASIGSNRKTTSGEPRARLPNGTSTGWMRPW